MADFGSRIAIQSQDDGLSKVCPHYPEQVARADEIMARWLAAYSCEPVKPLSSNFYEQAIVDECSTPGLRRNQFSHGAKKEQLASLKVPAEDAEKILRELYGDDGPSEG